MEIISLKIVVSVIGGLFMAMLALAYKMFNSNLDLRFTATNLKLDNLEKDFEDLKKEVKGKLHSFDELKESEKRHSDNQMKLLKEIASLLKPKFIKNLSK